MDREGVMMLIMKRLFLIVLVALYSLVPTFVLAEITSPYTVDEKVQVMFGDSVQIVATSTYQGLENYVHEYANDYLHITFTYTHSRFTFASYPPLLYVTALDPTATSSPTERTTDVVFQLQAFPVPPGHETDWYAYDVQFDATGYKVIVKEAGETEVINEHRDITGLTTSDWAALANNYPQSPATDFSMSFTPLQIYDAPAVPVATTTPVIIVPGIMGSKLEINGEEKWPNLIAITFSLNDSFLNDLILNLNLESINPIETSSIIRGLAGQDFFSGLFSSLENNSLEENEDSFEFPYDWRLDVESTALELKERIDEIKAERGVEKVDLVAHSMGGLLVKKYLEEFGGDSIEKFIDIGTPHTGAPKAFKILQYGDNFGFEKVGLNLLNPNRIKEISQNMPAVYELLPSQEYFDTPDDYYVFNAASGEDRLTFDQTSSYLNAAGRNSSLVDRANALHQEIDNLNPATYGVETYNIVGCGTPTIGQFYILDDTAGHPIYNIKMINGDGTVPLRSAEAMAATSTYYVKNAQHALMPSTSGVKELIADILTSTSTSFDISPYSNLAMSSSGCTIPDGRIVSMHSPIELHVYDSNGNHTGPDSNGDIENNIAGVTYEVIGDNKFAYLPNGVNYTIKGNATNSGTFDVRIQEVVGGEVATTTLFTNLPLTTVTQAQFSIGSSLPTYINLDNNNDGIFDQDFSASTITSGILEGTGHIAIVEEVLPVSSSKPTFEPVLTKATSPTEVPGVTIFAATSTPIKLTPILVSVKPKQANEAIEANKTEYTNTAIVYKSFGSKVKSVFQRLWIRIKSKL